MIPRRLLAPPPGWRKDTDIIVVGSGVAGVTTVLAIRRALPAARILLVTKSVLDDGSTRWAQGGIAAALGPGDTPDQHLADTLTAGLPVGRSPPPRGPWPRVPRAGPRRASPRPGIHR